uniref:Solute carrier family 17 member 9b n=1 Tax=Oncorhynchus mykiss TaxID=8022 RepID=A0A8C7QMM8_ONCMY
MAILQKHGKISGPDLVCLKETPSDTIGDAGGHQKNWSEHNTNWPRPLARVWTVVLLLGTCLLYCARVAMPICAVSMAEKFNWTKREQGMVLGSFFWGYCFTQVLGGYVSDRVGGEKVLLLSAAAWGAMTAFTPVLAHFCSQPIFSMTLARFLMGLLQGVHYPSLVSLCSQKVVESERGFLMSTVGSGSYLGTLVIGGAGSLMLDLYGWESVFYVSGLLSVLWAYCIWKYLLKGEGPIITLESLGRGGPRSKLSKRHWLRLFKQPAVCAVIITHLCTASTFFTMLSWLPTYFKDTFPDAKGWVFNVIPWFVAIPSSLFSGCLSDHLISRGNARDINYLSSGNKCSECFSRSCLCVHVLSPNAVFLCVSDRVSPGVLMVYFSGYLIEATGSWASVFTLITVVNLVGLVTFLAFAEARRVDMDSSKGHYHDIHI